MNQLFDSPISDDHLLRTLVPARLVSARRLAPGRYRIASAGRLALAAAVRVVHGIHRHAAHVRSDTTPARTSRFTQRNVFMLDVPDLSHRSPALDRDASNFARRHAQLCI